MDRVASGAIHPAATAWHCCLEFFSVSTRLPAEFRLTTADAVALIETEVLDRLAVTDLPPLARRDMLRQTVADRVFGGRVYDAHIAQVALEMGASVVLTDNRRHFLTSLKHGLQVQTPSEFLSARR
jgi:predicted nucleic acid-binding protein